MVDNSISQAPANAAPDIQAAPAPIPTFEPGTRTPDVLDALLSGADPAQLFGGQPDQPPEGAIDPLSNEPANQPQANEPGEDIPDKFKNQDGTLNVTALLKANKELEGVLGRQGDELGQYRGLQPRIEMLEGLLRQAIASGQMAPPQGQPQPEPPAPAEPEKGFELTPELKAQLEEEFIDDPVGLYARLIEIQKPFLMKEALKEQQPLLEKLQPLLEDYEFNQKVSTLAQDMAAFADKTPDFWQYRPIIIELANKYPALESIQGAPEILYNMAKGMAGQVHPENNPPVP
jgi:hypothetical protein